MRCKVRAKAVRRRNEVFDFPVEATHVHEHQHTCTSMLMRHRPAGPSPCQHWLVGAWCRDTRGSHVPPTSLRLTRLA